jgi:hypothetical protein
MRDTPRADQRIKGRLPAGAIVMHKPGTSDTDHGLTAATNDIGLIALPDGRRLAIAVLSPIQLPMKRRAIPSSPASQEPLTTPPSTLRGSACFSLPAVRAEPAGVHFRRRTGRSIGLRYRSTPDSSRLTPYPRKSRRLCCNKRSCPICKCLNCSSGEPGRARSGASGKSV